IRAGLNGIARFTQIDAPPNPKVAQFFGVAATRGRRLVQTAQEAHVSEERLSITKHRGRSSKISTVKSQPVRRAGFYPTSGRSDAPTGGPCSAKLCFRARRPSESPGRARKQFADRSAPAQVYRLFPRFPARCAERFAPVMC